MNNTSPHFGPRPHCWRGPQPDSCGGLAHGRSVGPSGAHPRTRCSGHRAPGGHGGAATGVDPSGEVWQDRRSEDRCKAVLPPGNLVRAGPRSSDGEAWRRRFRCGSGRWRGRRMVAGGNDGVALQHRGVKREAKGIPKWKGTELWWCSP
jgi:hypothetical protein